MKKYITQSVEIFLVIALVVSNAYALRDREISKTFDMKGQVEIETVSGDVIIRCGHGDKISVNLIYDYSNARCFDTEFRETRSRLILREHFSESCYGHSIWEIVVPEHIRLIVESASGDISVSGCEGDFELQTSSGRIDIRDSRGVFRLDDASGKIVVRRATGRFDVDNASGSIDVSDVVVEGESSFQTASGDVYVSLAESPLDHLTVESVTGSATLNYNGNPIRGCLEFSARVDNDDIVSPFEFEHKEEYTIDMSSGEGMTFSNGDILDEQVYVKRTFTKNAREPRICLKTATGEAMLLLE
jgi:hypothetical protein